MAEIGLSGIELIGVLQDVNIIPKELRITKVTIVAELDELVTVTYDTILPLIDAKIMTDTIIAIKAVERMNV